MADPFSEPDASSSEPRFESYPHPKTVFFHLFFRSAAVASYLLCTFFSASFVLDFVVIVMLLSFDFWTVKNVTGRLLVGLRWWNKVADDGTTEWKFESKQGKDVHSGESRIFWWSLYGYTVFWILCAITSLIKLSFGYLMLTMVALSLNLSNVIGYSKCEKDAKKKFRSVAEQITASYASQAVMQAASAWMFSGDDGSSQESASAKPTA